MGRVSRSGVGCRKQPQIQASAALGLPLLHSTRSPPPSTCSPPASYTGAASLCKGGTPTETFSQTTACSPAERRTRWCYLSFTAAAGIPSVPTKRPPLPAGHPAAALLEGPSLPQPLRHLREGPQPRPAPNPRAGGSPAALRPARQPRGPGV